MCNSAAMRRFGLAMVDVDGTLRGARDYLPGARDLLDLLGASGTPIALASGRMADSLAAIAEEFESISLLAASSGSVAMRRVSDGWVRFGQRYLPQDAVAWTAREAARLGVEAWAYTDERWILAEMTPLAQEEILITGSRPELADIAGRGDVTKMLLFPTRPEHEALVTQVKAIPGLDLVHSNPGYLDVVDAESAATKGGDFLIAELGIGWADVVAIGDGENDLGMLSKAGVACCLGAITPGQLAPATPGQRRVDCADLYEVIAFLGSLEAG